MYQAKGPRPIRGPFAFLQTEEDQIGHSPAKTAPRRRTVVNLPSASTNSRHSISPSSSSPGAPSSTSPPPPGRSAVNGASSRPSGTSSLKTKAPAPPTWRPKSTNFPSSPAPAAPSTLATSARLSGSARSLAAPPSRPNASTEIHPHQLQHLRRALLGQPRKRLAATGAHHDLHRRSGRSRSLPPRLPRSRNHRHAPGSQTQSSPTPDDSQGTCYQDFSDNHKNEPTLEPRSSTSQAHSLP